MKTAVLGHQAERRRVLSELLSRVCAAQILGAAARFVEHSGPEHELHAIAAESHPEGSASCGLGLTATSGTLCALSRTVRFAA